MAVKLTLLARSIILLISELLSNAMCWIIAGILFGRNSEKSVLSLALLAWTLGLRHALDADHIRFCSLSTLPVTCGLFFSLGHSSIVIAVTVAIAISSDVYYKINGVGEVGGIIGASISGAFLFIVGFANTIILWRIVKQRHQAQNRAQQRLDGEVVPDENQNPKHNHMLMMRVLGPIITFVNRPWKMYPVGVLFGLGFDTASSIALLAVSAIARKGSDGKSIPSSYIIIFPLLFTAGMTLIDSVDSILMLYSYSGFPEKSWALFERRSDEPFEPPPRHVRAPENPAILDTKEVKESPRIVETLPVTANEIVTGTNDRFETDTRVKMNVMSGLSIILTLMSILVAFSISLITIMGLIGEQCSQCAAAAEAKDGGGLAGSWWRGWAKANERSGYIGVAIVGGFLVIVVGWYGGRWLVRKSRQSRVVDSRNR